MSNVNGVNGNNQVNFGVQPQNAGQANAGGKIGNIPVGNNFVNIDEAQLNRYAEELGMSPERLMSELQKAANMQPNDPRACSIAPLIPILIALGIGAVATGCTSKHEEEITETTTFHPYEYKFEKAEISPERWAELKNNLLNDVIKNLNKKMNEQGTTQDGSLRYDYMTNGADKGEIRFKNPDGSYSDLRLGFNIDFGVSEENCDAKGNYTAQLDLTATPSNALTGKNVVDYIGLKGETFEKDGIGYKFSSDGSAANVSINGGAVTKNVGDRTTKPVDVVSFINSLGEETKTSEGVKYSFEVSDDQGMLYNNTNVKFENGFSCNIDADVSVKNNKPLGAAQQLLFDLGVISENPNGVITHTNTSNDAFSGTKKGVSFEVVPGDLSEITNGNPTVKMAIDIKGYAVDIEGKLSVENGVVTITDENGNKLEFTPGTVDLEGEPFNGASVSYNGQEVLRMAKDNFGGKDATTIAKVEYDDEVGAYTESRTHYFPEELEAFDGQAARGEAANYYYKKDKALGAILVDANIKFEEKRKELQAEYEKAVAALNQSCTIEAEGKAIPVGLDFKASVDADAKITWTWFPFF